MMSIIKKTLGAGLLLVLCFGAIPAEAGEGLSRQVVALKNMFNSYSDTQEAIIDGMNTRINQQDAAIADLQGQYKTLETCAEKGRLLGPSVFKSSAIVAGEDADGCVKTMDEVDKTAGRGGYGGSQHDRQCPKGYVLTGMNLRTGVFVDRVQGICSPIVNGQPDASASATRLTGISGGSGGSARVARCDSGSVAVGLFGRSGQYVDKLGIICAKMQNWKLANKTKKTTGYGGNGGGAFTISCPAGSYASGYDARSGIYLDRVALNCTGF